MPGVPQFHVGQRLTAADLNALAAAITENVQAVGGLMPPMPSTSARGSIHRVPKRAIRDRKLPVILSASQDGMTARCANKHAGKAGLFYFDPIVINWEQGPPSTSCGYTGVQYCSTPAEGMHLYHVVTTDTVGRVCSSRMIFSEKHPGTPQLWSLSQCTTGNLIQDLGVVHRDNNFTSKAAMGDRLYFEASNNFMMPMTVDSLPSEPCAEHHAFSIFDARLENTHILHRVREGGGICLRLEQLCTCAISFPGCCSVYDIVIASGVEIHPGCACSNWQPECSCQFTRPGSDNCYSGVWRTVASIEQPDSSEGEGCNVCSCKRGLELQTLQMPGQPWKIYTRFVGDWPSGGGCVQICEWTSPIQPDENSSNGVFRWGDWDFHVTSSLRGIQKVSINTDAGGLLECNITIERWWYMSLLGVSESRPGVIANVRQRTREDCKNCICGWEIYDAWDPL